MRGTRDAKLRVYTVHCVHCEVANEKYTTAQSNVNGAGERAHDEHENGRTNENVVPEKYLLNAKRSKRKK